MRALPENLLVFALGPSEALGRAVAEDYRITIAPHELRRFEDGEHKIRPLVSVRGRDVYVLTSLYGDASESVNDRLCRLVFFVGAMHDAGAGRITIVAPYLCYARKDRRTNPRDPVTTRYVAQQLEATGADRIVTLEVHNLTAYENAFRIGSEHLEAKRLFVERCLPRADRSRSRPRQAVGHLDRAAPRPNDQHPAPRSIDDPDDGGTLMNDVREPDGRGSLDTSTSGRQASRSYCGTRSLARTECATMPHRAVLRLECIVHSRAPMTITIGQLVATLFDAYDRSLHDEKLAAVATQVRIASLLEQSARARRTRTSRKAA